jgi:hypothetical protein
MPYHVLTLDFGGTKLSAAVFVVEEELTPDAKTQRRKETLTLCLGILVSWR